MLRFVVSDLTPFLHGVQGGRSRRVKMRASAARIRKLRLGYGGFVAVAVKAGHARSGVSASGVVLVLRSRQFPTFAFNSSKKFSTRMSLLDSKPEALSIGPS